jgi:hypothetical protein
MIQFMQAITVNMAAAEHTIRRSSKEYKEQDTLRRSKMTVEERRHEDLCKFNKRMSNF